MKSGRFFVTLTAFLGMAAAVISCNVSQRTDKPQAAGLSKEQQSAKQEQDALVHEGNAKIKKSLDILEDLKSKYQLPVASDGKISADLKRVIHTSATNYKWINLTKAERRDIQGKLAQYLALVNRVLEIDAKNNITIDRREQVLASRNTAELFQQALENFEQVYGENYEPKRDREQPVRIQNVNSAPLDEQETSSTFDP